MRLEAGVTLSLRDGSSAWPLGQAAALADSTFAARTMSSRLLLIDDDARLSAMVGDYHPTTRAGSVKQSAFLSCV